MFEFIYHPRSGDRVFIAVTGDGLGTVKYTNGCRHVACSDGVHIQFEASNCGGGWWRDDVKRLLKAYQEGYQIPMIAWDDRGTIHVCVRHADIRDVYDVVIKAATAASRDIDVPAIQLRAIMDGWGTWFPVVGSVPVRFGIKYWEGCGGTVPLYRAGDDIVTRDGTRVGTIPEGKLGGVAELLGILERVTPNE